jgi:hypothetical protein
MKNKLNYNTVTPLLQNVLETLMAAKEFEAFRLVGGTALSLFRGHRESVDIDLFTDAKYNSIDFKAIDSFLRKTYPYVDSLDYEVIGMGKSYYIGNNKDDCVKLDLYYTDKFIDEVLVIDGIRLASVEEIIAMKLDVICRGGRKKDFWDIHELIEDYSLLQMIAQHEQRYPFSHDKNLIKKQFKDFSIADNDFEPNCLRGKHWEIIKLDIIEFSKG